MKLRADELEKSIHSIHDLIYQDQFVIAVGSNISCFHEMRCRLFFFIAMFPFNISLSASA